MTVADTPSPTRQQTFDRQRAMQIFGFGALCLAGLGFMTGTRQAESRPARALPQPSPAKPVGSVADAPRYEQLRTAALSPNASWTTRLSDARDAKLEPPPSAPTLAAKRQALAQRATRRAYFGAPPVIPHRVEERRADSCLACHETGLRLGDELAASAMPHEYLVNCLQCHASQLSKLGAPSAPPANTFRGSPEPEAGARAWVGAPPVIPHATRMRSDCLACHGPAGAYPALASTHPWRVSCRQCHAASAGYAR